MGLESVALPAEVSPGSQQANQVQTKHPLQPRYIKYVGLKIEI